MMDHPGDDDAGETSAVTSKIQPMKPSDQEMATKHVVTVLTAIGAVLVLVALGGRTLTIDDIEEPSLLVACMAVGFSLMDRNLHRKVTAISPGEPLCF